MAKAGGRLQRNDLGPSAFQEDLELQDEHKITYYSTGNTELPLMLFVVGSSGLGSLYRRLSDELAAYFQCVYYDKRGFLPRGTSRESVMKNVNRFVPVGQNAGDAAALIKHISPHKPAFVFGTSTGATTVLDLAVRYTELVGVAILHEPITFSVMSKSAMKDEIIGLYQSLSSFENQLEGSKVYGNFMFSPHSPATSSALHEALDRQSQSQPKEGGSSQPPVKSAEEFNGRQGEQEGDAMLAYEVDIERARSIRDKMVLIRGVESKQWPISQPAVALAEALGPGKTIWELTGDHLSFAAKRNVAVFAGQLIDVLRNEQHIAPPRDKEQKPRL